MSVSLWRIATETRQYAATDLSGDGAATHPGRWNDSGEYVVYTASSISLAALETVAYINAAGLPLNRFVVRIEVADELWVERTEYEPGTLDSAWCAVPAGRASVSAGSEWYKAADKLFLVVPSVIVPEERNVIIHARHPLARRLSARAIRRFTYDALYRG